VIDWLCIMLDPADAPSAEAYLAAIVESSDDAIIAKDLDGTIRWCNAATERIFGYSSEELIGRPVRILIPADRQSEEDDILGRVRRGERIDHFETVRVAKDGHPIHISLTVSPVRDASGAIIGVSKTARDITAQKRAAAQLSAQQEWFRVTLGSIGDAVIASDADGHVSYMNATAESLTGWSMVEATGRPLADVFRIISEDTGERIENPASLVMQSGQVVGLANHTVLISRDGKERPIADSAAPIQDGEGNLLGVVLVFRDVTLERRAEEAIAEQREWLETTLESIGDAVIATDVNGLVVFMNRVAEQLTGYAATAAEGRRCEEIFNIVNEQTRRTVDNPATRVLAEGAVVGLANHTVLIAADGRERPIDDSGAPILNRDGHTAGAVLVFRDITERRRTELERQAAIAERERLLEAERIARTEAEKASRAKDDFVAMVSHELRTPLNAILGWTQLMFAKRNDPKLIDQGLDVVARNTRLQAQLISDLLDISRIVAGKLRLEMQNVDLGAIIGDAIETVQQQADVKGIELRTELDEMAFPIAGDPARLQQVVWNLLSNAIKFTVAGGEVLVKLRHVGADAELSVIDTGAGIQTEFLPFVFERFHQADRSITRRFGGLGLGLSIVKHLVELHGGTVRAESDGEGLGSCFTITLPTSTVDVKPDRRKTAPVLEEIDAALSLEQVRVLVVEDEPDTREFLARLLTSQGAVVSTAASVPEALTVFASAQPDILVSDIGLPGADGYDLLQQIRARNLADRGAIPAIALTAYARSEDRMRALTSGYQVHIAKPVESNELVAAIASLTGLMDAQRRTH